MKFDLAVVYFVRSMVFVDLGNFDAVFRDVEKFCDIFVFKGSKEGEELL